MKNAPTSQAPLQRNWQRFQNNRNAKISLIIVLVLLTLSLTAEFWANSKPIYLQFGGRSYFPIFKTYHPSEFGMHQAVLTDYRKLDVGGRDWAIWPLVQWDPYESNQNLASYPAPPSKYNLFGTDDRGRDVFARMLYGLRYTFGFALGVWAISYFIGITIGAVLGYVGGGLDLVGMRIVEVFESIPSLLLLLTLISLLSPSISIMIFFSVCFSWTSIATYMRVEFIKLRKREFVESARVLGATPLRIIIKHILPNALTPVFTFSPFMIAGQILLLTNLDYLGLGLPVPTPSWGELLSQGQKYITVAEWLVWWPSALLVLILLLFINIGLGLRDAFDVKSEA